MKFPREAHFLHPEARDPDFEGMTALCDYVAGLEEAPRVATLATAVREEVTCPTCLTLMNDE